MSYKYFLLRFNTKDIDFEAVFKNEKTRQIFIVLFKTKQNFEVN